MDITRRPIGPYDVLIDMLYCGICHSDIHKARDEWETFPNLYPCVPGHEIIGCVIAIGSKLTKFVVCDLGDVGIMVDANGTCKKL